MSPKPTQPEEIDLILNQMEDCDLKEYVPSLEMKLMDGVTKNGFNGASISPYRDAKLKLPTSDTWQFPV